MKIYSIAVAMLDVKIPQWKPTELLTTMHLGEQVPGGNKYVLFDGWEGNISSHIAFSTIKINNRFIII